MRTMLGQIDRPRRTPTKEPPLALVTCAFVLPYGSRGRSQPKGRSTPCLLRLPDRIGREKAAFHEAHLVDQEQAEAEAHDAGCDPQLPVEPGAVRLGEGKGYRQGDSDQH